MNIILIVFYQKAFIGDTKLSLERPNHNRMTHPNIYIHRNHSNQKKDSTNRDNRYHIHSIMLYKFTNPRFFILKSMFRTFKHPNTLKNISSITHRIFFPFYHISLFTITSLTLSIIFSIQTLFTLLTRIRILTRQAKITTTNTINQTLILIMETISTYTSFPFIFSIKGIFALKTYIIFITLKAVRFTVFHINQLVI